MYRCGSAGLDNVKDKSCTTWQDHEEAHERDSLSCQAPCLTGGPGSHARIGALTGHIDCPLCRPDSQELKKLNAGGQPSASTSARGECVKGFDRMMVCGTCILIAESRDPPSRGETITPLYITHSDIPSCTSFCSLQWTWSRFMIDANMLPASDAGESEDLTQLEVLPVGGNQASAAGHADRAGRSAIGQQSADASPALRAPPVSNGSTGEHISCALMVDGMWPTKVPSLTRSPLRPCTHRRRRQQPSLETHS